MYANDLIATIATGFSLALILGYLVSRIKMPPLVGYLLAGIAIGPFTPGFIGDLESLTQLADIGIMLLMFGVGLHFSINDLLSVKRLAIPGAIVQICIITTLGASIASYWGWELDSALVFGLCLSTASTVVLLRTLEIVGLITSINARIAIGWLIVEDLVMVFVLVLLPIFAEFFAITGEFSSAQLWAHMGLTIAKVMIFITFMLFVGRRIFPAILLMVSRTGSRELFILCVMAAAVGVAFAAALLFDVSFALGAFFAGMMMRESELSHRAATESLPLREAFSVLFFLSVGMLFDPRIVLADPMKLLAVVMIIIMGKTIVSTALVLAFRYPLSTALTVGASLAQIGEFSFILANLSVRLGLITNEGQGLILSGALISIAANSFVFSGIGFLKQWLKDHPTLFQPHSRADPVVELPPSTESILILGRVMIIGYGRVGRHISEGLDEHQIPHIVTDQNRELVDQIRQENRWAICGDACDPSVLIQEHIARVSALIVTIEDTFNVRKIAQIARSLNPSIHIILRSRSKEEANILRNEGLGTVLIDEQELARGITEHVLKLLE